MISSRLYLQIVLVILNLSFHFFLLLDGALDHGIALSAPEGVTKGEGLVIDWMSDVDVIYLSLVRRVSDAGLRKSGFSLRISFIHFF